MDFENKIVDIANELTEILKAKHADYGSKNLDKHGLYGILVRLDDKLSRMEHLIGKKENVKDETLRDTMMDIAGYAFQAVRFLDEFHNTDTRN